MRGEALLDTDDELPDELPDGLLVAGPDGRVTVLNRAARRLLGTTGDPLGRDYREVLPLVDSAGTDWWSVVSPYRGLANRTGHPERQLELRGSGREFLVTARYVRDRPGGPVRRLVVAVRDNPARGRAPCWPRSPPTRTAWYGSCPSCSACPGSMPAACGCARSWSTCRRSSAASSAAGWRPATRRTAS